MLKQVNKSIYSQSSVVLGLLMAVISESSAENATFKTSRSMLLDPCGEQMLVRGVNTGIAFPSDPKAEKLSEIAKTGANTVRLTFRWNINRSDPKSVAAALEEAVKNQMVAMPSIWDATGDWQQLPFAVEFWTQPEMVSVLRQYEDMLLLNIANEAGADYVTQDQFTQGYIEAIKKIREAGLHMPLVIDAAAYGRDESYILNNARSLIRNDPDHNLLFSWHPWKVPSANNLNELDLLYETTIDEANSLRIPLLIGEFSSVGPTGVESGNINYEKLLQYTAEKDVGWLWWWWWSGSNVDNHAMTTDGIYGNWANKGEEIASTGDYASPYGLTATSQRPSYAENRSCGGVASAGTPAAPSNLEAMATEGAEVVLTWSDNSRDEKNFDIEIWDESAQVWRLVKVVDRNVKTATIGAGAEFVYSMDSSKSLEYDTSYKIRVGAYGSRNAISYSEPVNVTTNSNPSICSNGDGIEANYYNAIDASWDILKTDAQIDFDWGTGSPDPSDPNAPTDHFKVAWYGEIEPQFDGEYTFYTDSDDFARINIDGNVILENWGANKQGWAVGKIQLTAGKKYSIVIQYREWTGAAKMSLYWAHTKLKREIVPQCRLFVYK